MNMAEISTMQLMNEFIEQKAGGNKALERTINSVINRSEVYEWETKLNKQLIEMNEDELLDVILSFRVRVGNNTGRRVSPSTIRNALAWYNNLWDYYSKNYKLIINPFRYDKLSISNVLNAMMQDTPPITSETIAQIINTVRNAWDEDMANQIECTILLFYCGFREAAEIVLLKEDMIDFKEKVIHLKDRDVYVSDRCLFLLRKVHEVESRSPINSHFTYVAKAYEGGYFKFFVKDEDTDYAHGAQQYLASKITRRISESSRASIGYSINTRQIFLAGFYNYLCKTFGKDKAHEMIHSTNNGEYNRILLDAAQKYGAIFKNPVTLKKDLLFYA